MSTTTTTMVYTVVRDCIENSGSAAFSCTRRRYDVYISCAEDWDLICFRRGGSKLKGIPAAEAELQSLISHYSEFAYKMPLWQSIVRLSIRINERGWREK